MATSRDSARASLRATTGSGARVELLQQPRGSESTVVSAANAVLTSIQERIENDTIELPVLSPLSSRANALRQITKQSTPPVEGADPADLVVGILGADPAAAARAIRLSSSPFVGQPQVPACSLDAAVERLGVPRVLHLLDTVTKAAPPVPEGCERILRKIWTNTIYTAQASAILARWVRHPDPAAVYLAALFHNIGEPLLVAMLGAHEQAVDLLMPQTLCTLVRQHHGDVGQKLLSHWGFPGEVARLAGSHHDPIHEEIHALVTAGHEGALRYGYTYLDMTHSPGRLGAALDFLGLHRTRMDAVEIHIAGSLNDALTLKG